jgi:hypothetical protein
MDLPQSKPCPFCGQHIALEVQEGSTFRWRKRVCKACGAEGPEVRCQTLGEGTPAEWRVAAIARAIEEWNVRAPCPDCDQWRRAFEDLSARHVALEAKSPKPGEWHHPEYGLSIRTTQVVESGPIPAPEIGET